MQCGFTYTETQFKSEWGNTLEFVWQTEFAVDGVVGVNISANSSLEQAVCTLTFPNSGNFPIGESLFFCCFLPFSDLCASPAPPLQSCIHLQFFHFFYPLTFKV